MRQPGAELHRNLRRIDVLALTVNVIVGAGVFAMPSAVAAIMLDYAAGLCPLLEARWTRNTAVTVFIAAVAAINVLGVKQDSATC